MYMSMEEVRKRFYEKVNKTDTCWLWTASLNNKGYGRFGYGGGNHTVLSHRFAYELEVGPIPPGLLIRHKCRNRNCCNPEHLETGTHADNEADKERDGTRLRNENAPWSKLTDVQVAEIRASDKSDIELGRIYGIDRRYVYALKKFEKRR